MAVERIPSDQYNAIVNDARFRPIDEHGKKRIVFFNVPAVTVAGDALSTFDLARLPPGAVRVLLAECKIQTSAWGAARLLDIGAQALLAHAGSKCLRIEFVDFLLPPPYLWLQPCLIGQQQPLLQPRFQLQLTGQALIVAGIACTAIAFFLCQLN